MAGNDKNNPPFDRQNYLREIRRSLLKNLGLPEDTKPDQVMRLLQIKELMKKNDNQ